MHTTWDRSHAAIEFPEARILSLCARTKSSSQNDDELRTLLQSKIDWDYLLRTATSHGMMPLLYWHLNAVCPEAVPKVLLDQLRQRFHGNAQHNLLLTRELLRLIKVFEAHGISAIAYKGPTLAALAYGNFALRQFRDLDILVRRKDALPAKRLLISLGYQDHHPQWTSAQEAAILRFEREYYLAHPGNGSTVELQWEIVRSYFPFPLDPEDLWRRLIQIPLGADVVPSLSPEDLLLVLCVHGSKHYWERLIWICDIAELVRTYKGIDWVQLMARAHTLGSYRMLLLGLFLADDLLGAELPEVVLQSIKTHSTLRSLAEQVYGRLFQEANGSHETSNSIDISLFHVRIRERLRDKILYCVRKTITPISTDWQLVQLPVSFSLLYYGVRVIRRMLSLSKRSAQLLKEHLL